jgi:hypothetical protein
MSKPPALGEMAKGHRSRLCATLSTPRPPGGTSSRLPLKSLSRILPILLAAATFAHSQDGPGTASIKTTARILHTIPDGSPPPAAPPKPEYPIASREILSSKTHQLGGRDITIRKIKPIALPPPPAPAEPAALSEDFPQRLAEYREAHPRSGLLFLGATVYRPKDGPPHSLVRYWPEGGREITFWSSADFALIAGGIQSFADNEGRTHHIFMSWGNVDIDRMTELLAVNGRTYLAPEIPNFPEGKAAYQIIGQSPPAEHLAAIQALHDIYHKDHAELLTAYQGREQARIEREAYLKANPPQPQNITLNYWRTTKPAAARKGASK